MRWATRSAVVAAVGCAVVGAPAGMAYADRTAIETIGTLEAEGYTVNIDRVGSGPLSTCVVTSVRNPQTVTRLVRVDNGRHRGGRDDDDDYDLVPVIVSRSISVSLNCSG